ncbi:outer membrane beta-barrel protein [Candidatus Colwellia aromaticivorans]|uniref:outer membrane beta-barrel protein n=1 Tax=Candidatus Colwellia aromaticivorans TaxID=2267621 RepID=UPI000DF269F5|nr:outer membrane beta-barrel protein [Candidatus Colwellia aromaticivorans]
MSIQLQIFSLLCLLFISIAATADESSNVEITPFVGYRFGGDFDATNNEAETTTKIKLNEDTSYGFLLAWDYDKKRQGELLVSHYTSRFSQTINPLASNNDLAITYAHIGGNVPISDGAVPFFVSGGLGLTHFSPNDNQLSNETRFSLNIGLSTKIPVSENVSLRFGGRVYATFFNSDSQIFCNENNCAISISSDLWVQSEVNAGITFSF